MTNEFNQTIQNMSHKNEVPLVETVNDLLTFDEQPTLMNREWDPSMAIKVKKGKKAEQ